MTSISRIEEFRYDSGEQFLNSPLVADFLCETLAGILPDDSARSSCRGDPTLVVDEDRHAAEFMFSVKATLVSGRKARTHK